MNGEHTTLMLFVWTRFAPDYTDGLACAIAHDEPEARQMICVKLGYDPTDWGELEVHSFASPMAFAVAGGG